MALCTTVKTCQNMVQYIACGYASHNWNLCDAYLDLYSWINNHPQHGYKVQLSTIAKVIVDILKQLNFPHLGPTQPLPKAKFALCESSTQN